MEPEPISVVAITTAQLLEPKKWVSSHADYLFRYALSRVRDEETARDLVQETFLSALKGLDRFQGKSTERTWLTSILKHKIIDVYRKESSGLKKQLTDAEELQSDFFDTDNGHWNKQNAPQQMADVIDPLQEKEFAKVMQKCMQKMPKLWSAVFAMKHLDEEKTEVILAELRLSAANFWVIVHRTKLSLRDCLQKNWL